MCEFQSIDLNIDFAKENFNLRGDCNICMRRHMAYESYFTEFMYRFTENGRTPGNIKLYVNCGICEGRAKGE